MEEKNDSSRFSDFGESKSSIPPYLCGRIINAIQNEKKFRAARERAARLLIILALSVTAFFAALLYLEKALVESEFTKVFSAILADPVIAAVNWKSFGLFLLESLPVTYVAAFLLSLLLLLALLKQAVKNLDDASRLRKLVNQN